MCKNICLLFIFTLFYFTIIAPQQSETNDQLEITDLVTESPVDTNTALNTTDKSARKTNDSDVSLSGKVYKIIVNPIIRVITSPKVNEVMRNIGTCMVNGAMELFTFYLPPAFLPLIASAAGFIIPFEPVVMLKERMPVHTYRRAFNTAMNTFLNTFDRFKVEDDYDPYMTRRFNRRFMDDDNKKDKE